MGDRGFAAEGGHVWMPALVPQMDSDPEDSDGSDDDRRSVRDSDDGFRDMANRLQDVDGRRPIDRHGGDDDDGPPPLMPGNDDDDDDDDEPPPLMPGNDDDGPPPLMPRRRLPGRRGPPTDARRGAVPFFRDTPLGLQGWAHGLGQAVHVLDDADDRRPIDVFHVSNTGAAVRGFHSPAEGLFQPAVDAPIERDVALSFRRFVTSLANPVGGRTVRMITFLMDWWELPDADVERLFRTVLPAHPTLESIVIFSLALLPARFLRMLTEAVPTEAETSLSRLFLMDQIVNDGASLAEHVRAVVDMLKRNAALAYLELGFFVEADQCKLICQALPRNTNLRDLHLAVRGGLVDALDGVAASSLRSLQVSGCCSEDAISSLAGQLRANTTLLNLRLIESSVLARRDSAVLQDFAKTYNYTLHTLELESMSGGVRVVERFEAYMSRNARIRDALEELKGPDPDPPLAVPIRELPLLLGLASDVPTVLYRILRMGYVRAVGERLLADDRPGAAA